MKRISTISLCLLTVHFVCAQTNSSYPVQNPPGCHPLDVSILESPDRPNYTLTAVASMGTKPFHYLWSTGDTTQQIKFVDGVAPMKHIEAENYQNAIGVAVEPTSDIGGGKDVGYIDSTDVMYYWDTIPSEGFYTIRFRVATPADHASFAFTDEAHMERGQTLANVDLPNTGGFQKWVTVSQDVYLTAGPNIFYITSTAPKYNSWNINWIEIVQKPKAASQRREAELWSAMMGVQAEPTTDIGGGQDVGFIDPGDWMKYYFNVPSAGTYGFNFRVASPALQARFEVRNSEGQTLATVQVPNTGGFQNWTTVHASLTLPAGLQALTLVSTSPTYNYWNINWLELTGAPISVARHVEAEDYTNMSGVVKEATSDAGGGQDVGYIDPGDWMEYQVRTLKAGYYYVYFRVAAANASTFQVRSASDSVLGVVNVPNTGGFQNWTTMNVPVYLNAGEQTIRLVSTGAPYHDWNLNWFEIQDDPFNKDNIYSVVVTDANGCKGYESINITDIFRPVASSPAPSSKSQPMLKLTQTETAVAITASPNPSSSYFTLQLRGKPSTPSTVVIYNQVGTVMEKIETLTGKSIAVGTSYPRGSYYAELIQGNQKSTVKLVKL